MTTQYDSYLFHKGNHYNSYKFMGAHLKMENKKRGVRFTTWAPNANCVYVVGSFNNWKVCKEYKLEKTTEMGLWSGFVIGVKKGDEYKFAIETQDLNIILKSDPYGRFSEVRPNTASIVEKANNYKWNDKSWISKRKRVNLYENPMNIYEMNLCSWKRKDGELLTYKDLKEELPKYLKELNYTHVEFMPIMEHPFDKSWGYQTTGFYSPTSRFGNPDDLRELIEELHKYDIGVILDWVPSHFCRDEHGLRLFDGKPVYEYEEEWKADNKGWGTLNFDLGRNEVRSFLISNAVYWIKEFHFDGLRIDAVANMLYLNYGRKENEWIPNKKGTNVNLEAVEFLKLLNDTLIKMFPNIILAAEESTTWEKVSYPTEEGGLGFNFKWNMGWMNDTLEYIETDPIYRKCIHNKMTFAMMYNHTEHFILPLSHDEVVHGKKSMVDKVFGDYFTKFAGLRTYETFMMGHPGKKLNFMGYEFGQFIEWKDDDSLDWHLIDNYPKHYDMHNFIKKLNEIYVGNKALWELDYKEEGFKWIDPNNGEQSIYSFVRYGKNKKKDLLVFICNFTSNCYEEYNIGVPLKGKYREILNTDSFEFGGSGQINKEEICSIDKENHNLEFSINLKIPPMGGIILKFIK